MAIKAHEFKLLQEYRNDGIERAAKLEQYQKDVECARARLSELQTQYEHVFTQSVAEGADVTVQLAKIDEDITLQKEVVARRERDFMLTRKVRDQPKITSVDVVDEFVNAFVPSVRAEYEPIVHTKLKMARDLLISCIIDHRQGEDTYRMLREEIAEMARTNRHTGKSAQLISPDHPTGTANVMESQGAIRGVRKVMEQVVLFTNGRKPTDFEYIAEVPKTNTKKDGK